MLPMGSWYAIPNHRTGLTVFTGPFTSIALVLLLLISVALTTFPLISAQADDCLAAPNAPAPHGTYWYYHLNRATQQKCWYVRTFDTHAQHATAQASSSNGAPLSIRGSQSAQMTPPAIEQPSRAKTFPIKPAREPSLNAVQNEEVYQRAGVTTGTTPEAASQESKSFETSVQAAAARPTVWPDAAIKVQEASAAPADVRVNLVSDEGAARSGEQANNSGVPIIVFPVLALGLVVVGFGSRAVLRNAAAAYRVRITESAETDTRPPQNRGKRRADRYQSGFVQENQELRSFISEVSDRGPFGATSSANTLSDEISIREAKLARLRDDIDRRLRGPEPAQAQPQRQKVVC